MITTNSQYLHCLSWGQTLQKVIAGTTTGLDPALAKMSVGWATTIYGKLQAVVNQYIATHPTSTSAVQV